MKARKSPHLLVAVVQDEDDGSGEEDGHEADAQTEDPVVGDRDVEVECGEDGAPHHHVEHLLKEARKYPDYSWVQTRTSPIQPL